MTYRRCLVNIHFVTCARIFLPSQCYCLLGSALLHSHAGVRVERYTARAWSSAKCIVCWKLGNGSWEHCVFIRKGLCLRYRCPASGLDQLLKKLLQSIYKQLFHNIRNDITIFYYLKSIFVRLKTGA